MLAAALVVLAAAAPPDPQPASHLVTWAADRDARMALLYLLVFDWPTDGRLGVPMRATIDAASLLGSKAKVYREVELGELDLPAGRSDLDLRALDKPGEAVLNLRSLRLVPGSPDRRRNGRRIRRDGAGRTRARRPGADRRGSIRSLALVGLSFTGAACSAVTTMFPDPTPRAPRRVTGTPWIDCKGIVHCHCHLSHDSDGTIAEIATACRDAHIDFLVMTDHQTEVSIRDGTRGMVGDTLFVVGAEVRSPQGTLLCFPLQRPLRRFQHPALLAKEAHDQGGLAFVCHGELWKLPFAGHGLDGAEIVNLHAGAMTAGKVGTLATGLFLPMRSLCERICVRDDVVFTGWDHALTERHPFTPIGGNDAHANVRLFGPFGGTLGTYREIFLTLSTHVLAARLDEAALVEAFAAGRTYVCFDAFGDGDGFDFRAVTADGTAHLGGATVVADAGLELCITTPVPGRIRLLADGQEVHARTACTMSLHDPVPGVYRVEVTTTGGDPWLFSSSIRIAARPAEPPREATVTATPAAVPRRELAPICRTPRTAQATPAG